MSDPVTKVEIEDVLSSIRRLVSEETRSDLRTARASPPVVKDRFVLTPSLRVEPDRRGQTPDQADAEVEAADASVDVQDAPDMSEPDADTEAHSADEPWRDPAKTLFQAARSAADHGSDDEGDWDEDPEQDLDPDQDGEIEAEIQAEIEVADEDLSEPEDAAAEIEPEPAEIEVDEPEPADSIENRTIKTDGDETTETAESETAEEDEEAAPEFQDVADADDAVDEADPEVDIPSDMPDRAATLSAKIEALEAAIGETQDQWEPDGDGIDDYAGTRVETLQWRDSDDDDGSPEPDPVPRPEPAFSARRVSPPADDAVLTSDETFLDEESLRELVADIVRQELQGALGERITRNVRKLVRREIHRALTAQELE